MAQQIINIGAAADDGTGDTVRDALDKVNDNFTEIYGGLFNAATQVVNVYSLDQLPTPVGEVITLEPNTVYLFFASVNFGTNRIVAATNSVLRGVGSIAIVLTYTGTGVFFSATDVQWVLAELTIVAQATGARVVNYTTNTLRIGRADDCTILCYRFADFGGTDWAVRLTNVSLFPFAAAAIQCSGTCRSFNYNTAGVVATTGAGPLIDLGTCVFESGVIRTIVAEFPTGSSFITGLPNSGNVSASGRFYVEGCQLDLSGGGTALTGVDPGDARWDFQGNTPIRDSRNDFLVSFENNTTNNTTITTAGTYVKVNSGNTFTEEKASGFTTDNTGRVTCNVVSGVTIPVDIDVSFEPASGSNKDLSVKVAKNGTELGISLPRRTSAGSPGVVAMAWQVELVENDYLEVFVTNNTDTTDILVGACIFRGN